MWQTAQLTPSSASASAAALHLRELLGERRVAVHAPVERTVPVLALEDRVGPGEAVAAPRPVGVDGRVAADTRRRAQLVGRARVDRRQPARKQISREDQREQPGRNHRRRWSLGGDDAGDGLDVEHRRSRRSAPDGRARQLGSLAALVPVERGRVPVPSATTPAGRPRRRPAAGAARAGIWPFAAFDQPAQRPAAARAAARRRRPGSDGHRAAPRRRSSCPLAAGTAAA